MMEVAIFVLVILLLAAVVWALVNYRTGVQFAGKVIEAEKSIESLTVKLTATEAAAVEAFDRGKRRGREEKRKEEELMMLQESGAILHTSMRISGKVIIESPRDELEKQLRDMKQHLARKLVVEAFEQGHGLRSHIDFEVRDLPSDFSSLGDRSLVAMAVCVPLIVPPPDWTRHPNHIRIDAGYGIARLAHTGTGDDRTQGTTIDNRSGEEPKEIPSAQS